jgi:hypothetical protein
MPNKVAGRGDILSELISTAKKVSVSIGFILWRESHPSFLREHLSPRTILYLLISPHGTWGSHQIITYSDITWTAAALRCIPKHHTFGSIAGRAQETLNLFTCGPLSSISKDQIRQDCWVSRRYTTRDAIQFFLSYLVL